MEQAPNVMPTLGSTRGYVKATEAVIELGNKVSITPRLYLPEDNVQVTQNVA